ncbi:MAG: hypothetical protein ABI837_02935 [Acidobacteriota bacterium]
MLALFAVSVMASFLACSDPDDADRPKAGAPCDVMPTAGFAEAANPDLADDPRVRDGFRRLLQRSRYGFDAEQAAFLVRRADGSLILVDWQYGGERNGASWQGVFPEGTIAIVHTHPCWLPMPSGIDRATARRSRVPVYVLTCLRIARTSGDEPAVVVWGDWSANEQSAS